MLFWAVLLVCCLFPYIWGGKIAALPLLQVGPTSKETSELQVKLLSSLLPKLWLKLGLAALKHAAAVARLRQRLLGHVRLSEAGKLSNLVVRAWKAAAVPSLDMVAAAEGFYWEMWQRQKLRLVRAWQAWAQRHRYGRGYCFTS